jgi:pilus assembly protein Flp/PilA
MSGSAAMRSLRKFFRVDSGATAIEYALIASGIAAAIIAVVMAIGTSVNGMYQSVANGFN